jgi:hypothetical protein
LARLEEQRELAGENEAEEAARGELRRRREAYHRRHRTPKRSTPSPESVAAVERSHHRREAEMMAQARPVAELEPAPAVDPALLAALRGYLARNPRDKTKHAAWLGLTLWAYDLVEGKPDRVDIEVALAELQGVAA